MILQIMDLANPRAEPGAETRLTPFHTNAPRLPHVPDSRRLEVDLSDCRISPPVHFGKLPGLAGESQMDSAFFFRYEANYFASARVCWTSLDIFGHLWTSLDIFGHLWTSLDIFGHLWTSLDIFGHLWTSLDIFGHLWTSLDIFGHLGVAVCL